LETTDEPALVDDPPEAEFVGIVNYAVLVLDRLAHEGTAVPDLADPVPARWADPVEAMRTYDAVVDRARALMGRKNHDYGDAWRQMLPGSFTDEIITRTLRFRELLLGGQEPVERAEDQFYDILNYSVLALVRLRDDLG
jgi:hypothetical protein